MDQSTVMILRQKVDTVYSLAQMESNHILAPSALYIYSATTYHNFSVTGFVALTLRAPWRQIKVGSNRAQVPTTFSCERTKN